MRLDGVRGTGAVVSAVLALVVLVLSVGGGPLARQIAFAGCIVAVPIGWWLAPRAARPGGKSVATTALIYALVAVPIGDMLVAIMTAWGDSSGPSTAGDVAGSLASFGLIVLGLPMFAIVFALAILWATIVQAIARPAVSGR